MADYGEVGLGYEISMLKRLVALDTDTNAKTNYNEMVALLKDGSEKLGAKTKIVSARNTDGKPRPNLVAYIDNGSKKTVALNAHFDALPSILEEWKTDPFALTEKQGKLLAEEAMMTGEV